MYIYLVYMYIHTYVIRKNLWAQYVLDLHTLSIVSLF